MLRNKYCPHPPIRAGKKRLKKMYTELINTMSYSRKGINIKKSGKLRAKRKMMDEVGSGQSIRLKSQVLIRAIAPAQRIIVLSKLKIRLLSCFMRRSRSMYFGDYGCSIVFAYKLFKLIHFVISYNKKRG